MLFHLFSKYASLLQLLNPMAFVQEDAIIPGIILWGGQRGYLLFLASRKTLVLATRVHKFFQKAIKYHLPYQHPETINCQLILVDDCILS